MKKFTITGVFLAVLSFVSYAQVQNMKKVSMLFEAKETLSTSQKSVTANDYFQDFQSQPVTDMTNIKVDNNTQASNPAYLAQLFAAGWNTATSLGDGNNFAASSSIFTPAGTANRWLITPAISITAPGASLSWKGRTVQQTAATFDTYEVYITSNIAGATPVVSDFSGSPVFTQSAEPATWTDHTYTLPGSYTTGSTLYVAFRHTSNNKQILGIDDIRVGSNIVNDITAQKSFVFNSNAGYCGLIPRAQLTPVYFAQDVKNQGSNAQTNVVLTTNVRTYPATVNVFTGTSLPYASLASLANDTLAVETSFIPPATGTGYEAYQALFSVTQNQTDENLTNNKDTIEFIITDNEYCHSYNYNSAMSSASLAGIGGTTGTIIGNIYNFPAQQIIDSLYMLFYTGTSTSGVSVKAKVFLLDNSGIPVEVATSASHTVTPSDISSTTTLVETTLGLTSEYTVPAGSNIVAGFELTFATNTVIFICDGSSAMNGVNTFYLPTNSQGANWYNVTGPVPFIGMLLKDVPSAVFNTKPDNQVSVYPNPTTGKLLVENAMNSVVTVFNILGQEVVKLDITSEQNTIDISGMAEGPYFVKVRSEGNVITKKINLVK